MIFTNGIKSCFGTVYPNVSLLKTSILSLNQNINNIFPFKYNTQILNLYQKRWATKKAGGSSRNGRDSESKRLGLKKSGGQHVIPGNIIIRQRGTKYHPGTGVGIGKDHTIYSLKEGWVAFRYHVHKKRQYVYVADVPPKQKVKKNMKANIFP